MRATVAHSNTGDAGLVLRSREGVNVRRATVLAGLLLLGMVCAAVWWVAVRNRRGAPSIAAVVTSGLVAYRQERGHDPASFLEVAPYLDRLVGSGRCQIEHMSDDRYSVVILGAKPERLIVAYRAGPDGTMDHYHVDVDD